MDFGSIVDILFIIGAIALGFFPGVKKMLGEETAKKIVRPVYKEPVDEQEEGRPKRKKKSQVSPPQPEQDNEYFSYETMSDRDFEKEFQENVESEVQMQHSEKQNTGLKLTMDEEEVYKGVVWSEILNRKY